MGATSKSKADASPKALGSPAGRGPDGSHPESISHSLRRLPEASRARLAAVWARPITKILWANLVVAGLVGYVVLLMSFSLKDNKSPHHPSVTASSHASARTRTSSAAATTGSAATRTSAGSNAQAGTPPTAATTLIDRAPGFELNYPSTWIDVTASTRGGAADEGHVVQIANQSAFSIRTFPLKHPLKATSLGDMRAVTDAILSTPSAKLDVIEVQKVTVANKPAVYYLYYFPAGKQRGLHAHYFVFDGTRMHSLVFQVVPAADFPQYAAAFDQVISTFKTLDQ